MPSNASPGYLRFSTALQSIWTPVLGVRNLARTYPTNVVDGPQPQATACWRRGRARPWPGFAQALRPSPRRRAPPPFPGPGAIDAGSGEPVAKRYLRKGDGSLNTFTRSDAWPRSAASPRAANITSWPVVQWLVATCYSALKVWPTHRRPGRTPLRRHHRHRAAGADDAGRAQSRSRPLHPVPGCSRAARAHRCGH